MAEDLLAKEHAEKTQQIDDVVEKATDTAQYRLWSTNPEVLDLSSWKTTWNLCRQDGIPSLRRKSFKLSTRMRPKMPQRMATMGKSAPKVHLKVAPLSQPRLKLLWRELMKPWQLRSFQMFKSRLSPPKGLLKLFPTLWTPPVLNHENFIFIFNFCLYILLRP